MLPMSFLKGLRRGFRSATLAFVLTGPCRAEAVSAEAGASANERARKDMAEAFVLMRQNEFTRAEVSLDRVIAMETGAGPLALDLAIGARLMRMTIAESRGNYTEARAWLDKAEALLASNAPDAVRLAVLERKEGWLHVHGELREALVVADEMMTLAELRRDQELISRVSQECGMLLYKLGDLAGADARAERAVAAAEAAGSRTALANAKKLRGNIASGRGEKIRALAFYDEALAVFLETGNRHEAANCHFNAASVLRAPVERVAMRERLKEAEALFTEAASLGGVGLCRMLDGEASLADGDLLRAAERLEDAERIFSRANNRFRLG